MNLASIRRRKYPVLAERDVAPRRPLSFIVVRFSDDYLHNILLSPCIRNPLNQLITIDNRCSLFFDNLSQAINAGIERTVHELIAVVHEDVLLPDGWQSQLEKSLDELEQADAHWGLLGAAGFDGRARPRGHWSDPYGYRNTLHRASFARVRTIDEHLMILRKSSGLRFDDLLPGIHYIARSRVSALAQRGLATYVVNAPTIHKYSDETGKRIQRLRDSPKIRARKLPAYLADLACSDEYLHHEHPEWRPRHFRTQDWEMKAVRPEILERLTAPIILLARGGSGSRLLSWLALDAGVFLGNGLGGTGDSMEMVQDLYMGVLNKYQRRASWQKERIVPRIRLSAARMLERAENRKEQFLPKIRQATARILRRTEPASLLWGFKLPEAMLLLPELHQAFSNARYLHLIRDPLTTCLRRTHMTARFDNAIGRIAIREAYRYCGRDLTHSLDDSPELRMAYTTIHQVETVRDYARSHLGDRYLEIRFEDALKDPRRIIESVSRSLGTNARGDKLEREIDPERATRPAPQYRCSPDREEAVARALAPLRRDLGYA